MQKLASVIDLLDRPGGHILLGVALLALVPLYYRSIGPTEGHDLFIIATTLLGRSMIGLRSVAPAAEQK